MFIVGKAFKTSCLVLTKRIENSLYHRLPPFSLPVTSDRLRLRGQHSRDHQEEVSDSRLPPMGQFTIISLSLFNWSHVFCYLFVVVLSDSSQLLVSML